MKVGVLSMQQIVNYGSFLQARALRSIIERLGHEVEFIDIVPGEQLPQYRLDRFHKLRLLLKRIMVRKPYQQLKYTYRLHKRFKTEFLRELGINLPNAKDHFDVVVIGSDEVFNIAQKTWFGFSPQLFGAELNTDKVITYAACFGATTIDIIGELGLQDRLSGLLKNISAISVRDQNSKDIITELTESIPFLHVDPVLAYDFKDEIKQIESREPYMLIYTYPGRMNDENEIKSIRAYANKNGLRIISNANYFDWVDEIITPHPFEVLSYFINANCVVTDTFHGSVMSIKFNKRFLTIVRNSNRNKLSGLLSQFKLNDRIVSDMSEFEDKMEADINYSIVNEIISHEQLNTISYLRENLV